MLLRVPDVLASIVFAYRLLPGFFHNLFCISYEKIIRWGKIETTELIEQLN